MPLHANSVHSYSSNWREEKKNNPQHTKETKIQIKSTNPKVKMSSEASQCLLSLCFKVLASAMYCGRPSLWNPPLSNPPCAMNPTESEEAIKIPSCHKKPLRRVEVGRLLADMKRIPAPDQFSVCIGLSAFLKRVRQNCPADQEALNFYNLHFHSCSHWSGISATFTKRNSEKTWKSRNSHWTGAVKVFVTDFFFIFL